MVVGRMCAHSLRCYTYFGAPSCLFKDVSVCVGWCPPGISARFVTSCEKSLFTFQRHRERKKCDNKRESSAPLIFFTPSRHAHGFVDKSHVKQVFVRPLLHLWQWTFQRTIHPSDVDRLTKSDTVLRWWFLEVAPFKESSATFIIPGNCFNKEVLISKFFISKLSLRLKAFSNNLNQLRGLSRLPLEMWIIFQNYSLLLSYNERKRASFESGNDLHITLIQKHHAWNSIRDFNPNWFVLRINS